MPEKPQRKDAAERRQAILAAAEIAFAEKGLDVPLDEICVAAGVGRATLYRNFANRIVLIHSIMRNNIAKLDAIVADVAADPDGLETYLAEILEQLVKTGGLVYLNRRDPGLNVELSSRYLSHLGRLVAVARDGGRIRPDASTAMVQTLVRMMWGGLDGLSYAERRASGPLVFDLCLAALGQDKALAQRPARFGTDADCSHFGQLGVAQR
jgi:AcrR family transcriptional regulator